MLFCNQRNTNDVPIYEQRRVYMSENQHRATLRVLQILNFLAEHDRGYGLGEIAQALKIPKGSLSPIIHTMEDNKYLHHNGVSGKYTLGIKCYEVGSSYIAKMDITNEIKKIVEKVVGECNETCHFAILDGKEVIYLLKEESSETIRMVSTVGKRVLAHATAIGKALLIRYSKEELDELYKDGLATITPKTISDLGILYKQLDEIRNGGFAYESEESSLNVKCVAVPILKKGEVNAAISVSVPIFRADEERMKNIEQSLKTGKAAIEVLLRNSEFKF